MCQLVIRTSNGNWCRQGSVHKGGKADGAMLCIALCVCQWLLPLPRLCEQYYHEIFCLVTGKE